MKPILIFLASLITVYCVGCANGCSGHGMCSVDRECLCFRQQGLGLNDGDFENFGWTGADCSIRMCPQGLSYASQTSQNTIPWFNIGTEIYKAGYDSSKDLYFSRLNEELYKVIKIDEVITELIEADAGGRAICYDENMTFIANIDVFAADQLSTATLIYGIPTSFSSETTPTDIDKELEKIRYCRIPYIRKDISLLTFFTLKQLDDEKKDMKTVWTRELTGKAIKDVLSYIGKPTSMNIDIACRNAKTGDAKAQYITVHTVKIDTTIDSESLRLTIDKTDDISGSCSFLYSPFTGGSISLKESELYNLIGTENYFGYQIEDGVLLWVDNSNITENNESYSVLTSEFKLTSKTYTNEDFNKITNNRPSKSEGEIKQILQKGKEVAIISFGVTDNTTNQTIQCDYVTEMTFVTLKDVKEINENKENGIIEYTIEVTPLPYINRNNTFNNEENNHFLPVGILISNIGPHSYTECSGAGTCNRNTGKCECYEGYYGSACQRVKCPNDCNKRGKCITIREYFNDEDEKYYGDSILPVCKCDGGYRGIDCSQIECPSSTDPNGATNIDTSTEYRDCSGRGVCDYSSGKCECFKGYAGEACNTLLSTY